MPFVVVPYKVHSELDELKFKTKNKCGLLKKDPKLLYSREGRHKWKELNILLCQVCKANHAINSWKKTHSKQFLGQSAAEHLQHVNLVTIKNANDEILNFSHQMRAKYSDASVIILSNDVNFRNRANACFDAPDVPAYEPSEIFIKLDDVYNKGKLYLIMIDDSDEATTYMALKLIHKNKSIVF